MGNVVLIRKHRRKKSLLSWFRRKVVTASSAAVCIPCDHDRHHYGKPREGCHCGCGRR